MIFLGRPIDSGKWSEHLMQCYIIQELRRRGIMVEGDMNAARRGFGAAARAKASGMTAGTPDLRIFLTDKRLVLIELKLTKGKLSESQKLWHKDAAIRGFTVHTIYADTPLDAMKQVLGVLGL